MGFQLPFPQLVFSLNRFLVAINYVLNHPQVLSFWTLLLQGGEDLCKAGLSKMFSKRRKSESQLHPEINFEEVREDDGRQLAA